MTQLKQRSRQAYVYLYDTYSAALYTCVLQIVKDEEVAAPVTTEVFLCIWREIDQYDASKERLFTWLSKIARRVALHEVQLREAQRSKPHAEADIATPKEAIALMDHCGLKAVMHTLNEEQGTLINLRYFEGLTCEQIADDLHVPVETVQLKVHSALKQLNHLLS